MARFIIHAINCLTAVALCQILYSNVSLVYFVCGVTCCFMAKRKKKLNDNYAVTRFSGWEHSRFKKRKGLVAESKQNNRNTSK